MNNKANLEIFVTFFKIGATTFGGGYAMLPIIKREVVENREWLNHEEFIDVLAVAQSSPGAIAVNSAVFIGQKLQGFPGAISALLGSVLPSFIVILTIAMFFTRITEHPVAVAAFAGIRPAIAALIAAAMIKVGKPVFKRRRNIILTICFLLLTLILDFHPIVIILLGAGAGLLFHWLSCRQAATEEETQ